MPGKKNEPETYDWSLEEPMDEPPTLEELVRAPAFKVASDKLGHSITVGTRIPSWLNRRIIKLKETTGTPYEVNSDVVRDALYLGLRILHLRYTIAEDWNLDTKLANVKDLTSQSKQIKSSFEEFENGLEDLFRNGDEVQAAHHLSAYVITVTRMENQWHRGKVFNFIAHSKICREVVEYCDEGTRKLVKKVIDTGSA